MSLRTAPQRFALPIGEPISAQSFLAHGTKSKPWDLMQQVLLAILERVAKMPVTEVLLRWHAAQKQQHSPVKTEVLDLLHFWTLLNNVLSPFEKRLPTLTEIIPITITFAAKNKLARKVVRRSAQRVTGKYPSIKMGSAVQFESSIEQSAYRLLDLHPNVSWFRAQPAQLSWRTAKGLQVHYPDALALVGGIRTFFEFKDDDLNTEIAERTAFLSSQLPALGYQYLLVQRRQIQSGAYERNAEILRRLCARHHCSLYQAEQTRLYLAGRKARWEDILLSGLKSDTLARLIVDGYLATDMSRAISSVSQVWWHGRPQGVA